MYVSRDICSPLALAHLAEHMSNTTVGCDAAAWTKFHPSEVMFSRFLKKCASMNTKVKLFNYKIVRPDIDALLLENRDVIECSDCALEPCAS